MKVQKIIANAEKSMTVKKHFHAALADVFPVFETYPYEVWCAVGKVMAEEGAYRILLEREEDDVCLGKKL